MKKKKKKKVLDMEGKGTISFFHILNSILYLTNSNKTNIKSDTCRITISVV
jgi:hypothetical protein